VDGGLVVGEESVFFFREGGGLKGYGVAVSRSEGGS
jgi:hypothetical protein